MIQRASLFVGLVAAVCIATTASAATLNLKVTTDKPVYAPGDTVTWTITAWASTADNRGVSMLGVDLAESQLEALTAALVDPVAGDPTTQELHLSLYNHANGFLLASDLTGGTPGGTYDPDVPGVLSEVGVFQPPFDAVLDEGNDGQEHVFATGSYVASAPGMHQITPTLTSALYWADDIGTSRAFEKVSPTSGAFTVTPEPATLSLLALGGLLLGPKRRFRPSLR